MKPTPELIFALRRTAVRILDPKEDYRWSVTDSCNCGILVREVCGLKEEELSQLRWNSNVFGWGYYGGISNVAELMCKKTDLPMSFIFQTMEELGFESQDYNIVEQAGTTAKEVHDFFINLANELESQLPPNQHHIRKNDNECITTHGIRRVASIESPCPSESHKS